MEDGELVDNLFITKLTKVLETLIKLHLFFKQLENSTVTPLFQFIICSVFLNRPIVDCWPLAILCFSFPSNFEVSLNYVVCGMKCKFCLRVPHVCVVFSS